MSSNIAAWGRLAAVAVLVAVQPLPAFAGPAEDAYLEGYVGGWRGTGLLRSDDGGTEDFTCRVTVSKGRVGKINYAGRCSVAGLNLSVAGTIAYIDAAGRYEAAMTSNASFAGTAVGRRSGDRVVFDLRESGTDAQAGSSISAQVSLGAGDIGLAFTYTQGSGEQATAAVTFARHAS